MSLIGLMLSVNRNHINWYGFKWWPIEWVYVDIPDEHLVLIEGLSLSLHLIHALLCDPKPLLVGMEARMRMY